MPKKDSGAQEYMSRKGPVVVKGMLDFIEDFFVGVLVCIKSPS